MKENYESLVNELTAKNEELNTQQKKITLFTVIVWLVLTVLSKVVDMNEGSAILGGVAFAFYYYMAFLSPLNETISKLQNKIDNYKF